MKWENLIARLANFGVLHYSHIYASLLYLLVALYSLALYCCIQTGGCFRRKRIKSIFLTYTQLDV